MASERWTNARWPRVGIDLFKQLVEPNGKAKIEDYLIVNESPRLEKCMYSHNGADISCKISSTSSDGEVFRGIEAICVDHEVAVVLIDCWRFASVATIEELW